MSSSSGDCRSKLAVGRINPFVHNATLDCAVSKLCIPCMYKIFHTGTTACVLTDTSLSTLQLPANVRPEMCPRAKSFDTRLYNGLYTSNPTRCRILTVGDGDLSFSLSIAKYYYDMFGSARNIVATTHESYDSVCSTYHDGKKHIDLLTRLGATVYHQVDATNLAQTLPQVLMSRSLPEKQFHFVLWNFPCIRVEKGADGQVSELEQNQQLIRRFFANIESFLVPHVGEVHLAHKTIEPFSWWGITDIAREEGFNCHHTVVFDRCNYPGYINRKVLDKKSFPCNDALIYVFLPRHRMNEVVVDREESGVEKEKKKKKKREEKRKSKSITDDIDGIVADKSVASSSGNSDNCSGSADYMQSLTSLNDFAVQTRLHSAIQRLLRDGTAKSSKEKKVERGNRQDTYQPNTLGLATSKQSTNMQNCRIEGSGLNKKRRFEEKT